MTTVQPVDASASGAFAPQVEHVPAPREADVAARSVAHAPVKESFGSLTASQAGLPVEQGDKGRIVRIMV
jgi:hypothetical protein